MSKRGAAVLLGVLGLLASGGVCGVITAPDPAGFEASGILGDWIQVTVEGIVTYIEPTECYVEAADRSSGIWVIGPTAGIEVGDPVIAFGSFAVIGGEPAVIDASIYLHGPSSQIRPFAMSNRAVGGASKWSPLWVWDYTKVKVPSGCGWAWQREWMPACGASSTGLLVTTCGTVKSVYYSPETGASWFYIDDGSACVSDLGDTGLLVYGDAELTRGDTVAVTGISSVEPSKDLESRLVRVLRTRSAGDVRVIQPYQPPVYPFSDEFDSPDLDPRWGVGIWAGEFSLTEPPGWLTFTPTPRSTYVEWRMGQKTHGDWDMEVKVQLDLSADERYTHQEGGVSVFGTYVRFVAYADSYDGRRVILGTKKLEWPAGDTCIFRIRQRGDTTFGSVSLDGASFSEEYSVKYYEPHSFSLYTLIRSSQSFTPDQPFRAHFDYIRISTVGE